MWLFRRLLRYLTSMKKKVSVKHHVTFTKSTLQKERERKMRNIASPMPFKNFVNELSLIVMDKKRKDRMTLKESALMRKTAVRMWRHLDENLKNRYRRMAIIARSTRGPKSCLNEEKNKFETNIQVVRSVQKMEIDELDDLGYMPRRCRSTRNMKRIYDKRKPHTAEVVKNCVDKARSGSVILEPSPSIRMSRKRPYPTVSERKKKNMQRTSSSNCGCCELPSISDKKNPRLNWYRDQEDPN